MHKTQEDAEERNLPTGSQNCHNTRRRLALGNAEKPQPLLGKYLPLGEAAKSRETPGCRPRPEEATKPPRTPAEWKARKTAIDTLEKAFKAKISSTFFGTITILIVKIMHRKMAKKALNMHFSRYTHLN